MMSKLSEIMDTRGHFVEFEVAPVKFLGFTIKEGYKTGRFVECSCGETVRERIVGGLTKTIYRSSGLWQSLVKKQAQSSMYDV